MFRSGTILWKLMAAPLSLSFAPFARLLSTREVSSELGLNVMGIARSVLLPLSFSRFSTCIRERGPIVGTQRAQAAAVCLFVAPSTGGGALDLTGIAAIDHHDNTTEPSIWLFLKDPQSRLDETQDAARRVIHAMYATEELQDLDATMARFCPERFHMCIHSGLSDVRVDAPIAYTAFRDRLREKFETFAALKTVIRSVIVSDDGCTVAVNVNFLLRNRATGVFVPREAVHIFIVDADSGLITGWENFLSDL